MADLWLLDSNEVLKEKLSLTKAHHVEEINGENTLSFDTVSEVEKNDRVLYRDDNDIYHEFIVQEVVEDNKSLSAYCEHSAYELHGDFVTNKRPTGTPLVHLTSILENSRWDFRVIGGFESQMISYYRISVYQSINKMLEAFKAYRTYEIEVTGNQITKRTIVIWKELGFDLGRRFVYSKDLENVTRTVMMDDIITALYGFGKGEEIGDGYGRRLDFAELDKPDSPKGKMYVEDLDALALYGRNSSTGKKHVFGDEVFDDIEDVEELYEATKEKLHMMNEPKINYTTEVILLSDSSSQVSVGDKVTIIDNDFRGRKLRLKGQVFKMKRDLLSPANSTIQLGNYISDTADADNKLNEFVNNFRNKAGIWDRSNAFDTDGALDSSKIKDILEGWNASLNASGGFVYAEPGQGIITYDRAIEDDPKMAIQITGAGWRIANSKDSEGEWDWRTLGTGDGIYGDQIVANSITTNQLASDVGSSLDLSSNTSINLMVSNVEQKIEDIELTPGPKGDTGDTGADGKGIATTVVEYQKSGSGSAVPTDSWSTTLPAVLPNEYLWTRTTINYTTGSPSVAYSVGRVGKDGVKGDKGDKGETGSRGATGAIGPRGDDGTSVLGIVEFYGLSTSDTVKPTSWTEIVSEATPLPKMTTTQKYLWNYEKINFSNGSNQDTIPVIVGVYGDTGDKGSTGSAGVDGRSIVSIKDKYLVTSASSGVTRSTSGWVDTPTPTDDVNKYLWNYEIITWNKAPITTYVDPIIIGVHGNKGDKGDTGAQGIPGQKGQDGKTTYTWIKYADTPTSGMSDLPTGKKYMGIAINQTTQTESTNYADYKWSKVEGDQGIPGTPGTDGKPVYTWIKYADTPTTGMDDDPTGKKYIGLAFNKTTATKSTNYGEYQWSLMPQNITVGGRNYILDSANEIDFSELEDVATTYQSTALTNLVSNGDFSNGKSGWTTSASGSIVDGRLKVTRNGSQWEQNIDIPIGNTIYIKATIQTISVGYYYGSRFGYGGINIRNLTNEIKTLSGYGITANKELRISFYSRNEYCEEYYDNLLLLDLTSVFGKGNEPTKEEMDLLVQGFIPNLNDLTHAHTYNLSTPIQPNTKYQLHTSNYDDDWYGVWLGNDYFAGYLENGKLEIDDIRNDNYLLDSDVYVEESSYLMMEYDVGTPLIKGEFYTATIWGGLADTKNELLLYNFRPSGNDFITSLIEKEKGVYQATFQWNWEDYNKLRVYHAPNGVVGTSIIEKIKLEKGSVATPYISHEDARDKIIVKSLKGTTISHIKLEQGDIATDWSPAPEDVQAEIDDNKNKIDDVTITTTEHSSAIAQTQNSIAQEILERKTQGELIVEQTSSLVQQTVDSFDVIFNKIEADQVLTNREIKLIQSYFRINENGVIIGKSNSAIEFFAENNRVGFRENGNDIAYWEEGTMHVDRLIAVTTIMVGYHLIEKYDSPIAGNTSIVRLGD